MTEQESKDLEILKAEILKKKELLYDVLRSLNRADIRELVNSGYRNMSNGDAMQKAFNNIDNDIKKLHAAHLRKYPD